MDDNRNLFLLIVRISIEKLNLLPILSKCGHRIMIFCDVKNAVIYSKHFDVMEFEDIGENHLVELAVLDLRKDYNIKKIIVLEEHDIIRAAQLREYLNIEGQNLESALLFRDKFLLKQRVRGKIPVADYRLVESPIDIKEFIDEYDFPVVMKPRDGMGSIDVSIIRNLSELNLWVMHHYKSNIFG